MPMTKDQRAHLEGRIAVARVRLGDKLVGKPSAAEVKAERDAKKYDQRERRARTRCRELRERREARARRAIDKRLRDVREAMLFDEPKRALAAIKALEKAAQ